MTHIDFYSDGEQGKSRVGNPKVKAAGSLSIYDTAESAICITSPYQPDSSCCRLRVFLRKTINGYGNMGRE